MEPIAGPSSGLSFQNEASRIANQTSGNVTIQGDQNNYWGPGPSAPPVSRCVSVPYATVSTYTARPSLSQNLAQKLAKPHRGGGIGHAVAVTGLGGTGKTQLVLKYIEDHKGQYSAILWIDGRSEETARSSFVRCCHDLRLPYPTGTEQVRLQDAPAVRVVLLHLEAQTVDRQWLCVIDNVDDLSWEVGCIVPRGSAGSVIITSQDSQASRLLGRQGDVLDVDVMETEEALSLLYSNMNEGIEGVEEDVADLANQIVELLDRLPLAVELAGARISAAIDDGEGIVLEMRRYVSDYARHKDRLLRTEEFLAASRSRKSMWTAWDTTLFTIKNQYRNQTEVNPIEMLELLSQFDRANIQDEMFRLASLGLSRTSMREEVERALPVWLRNVLSIDAAGEWDDLYFRENLRVLRRFGMIRRVEGKWTGVSMHALVQWRGRQEGNAEKQRAWHVMFIAAAHEGIEIRADKVPFRRHMMVHLPTNGMLRDGISEIDLETRWWALSNIGGLYYNEGRFSETEVLIRMMNSEQEEMLGEDHLETLSSLDRLVMVNNAQQQWGKAQQSGDCLLKTVSAVHGERAPLTLASMQRLTLTYFGQRRLDKAEEPALTVLQLSKEALGERHPDTLSSMSNLADIHEAQGRLDEAEELGLRVVKLQEEKLGKRHPDTLRSMSNLANNHRVQGRLEEAEGLGLWAVKLQKETLGERHPNTLVGMSNLTITYRLQGRLDEAERLGLWAVKLQKETLGERHPNTLVGMSNLAITYRLQGRLDEAEDLGLWVVKLQKETLGDRHPDTLTTTANLAGTYMNQGRPKEAEELWLWVVKLQKEILGERHPHTRTTIAHLAGTYMTQGRLKEAEELWLWVTKPQKEIDAS